MIVQSDHKLLDSIMKKPLSVVPPRLQRMLLQLQTYDLHFLYVHSKNIPLADTLSRKKKGRARRQRHCRRPRHSSPLPLQHDACLQQEDAAVATCHRGRPLVAGTTVNHTGGMARNPPELQTHHLRILELPRSIVHPQRHHVQGRENPCTCVAAPKD